MRIPQLIIATGFLFFITGCASMKPAAFEKSSTKVNPVQFFIGHTRSSGVVETPGGKPTSRITTETVGVLKDSLLTIEQDLFPEGGKKTHRSWKLHIKDQHHIEGTAEDISGTAHGLLYGNEFSWTFRLKPAGRKFIKHVRMSQAMYVMPDGQTMIIRSVIRKVGIVVAQITEQFHKY